MGECSQDAHVGDIIKGTVTRIVPFGAFVGIDGGVEGIIPNSELAYKRFAKPDDIVSAGEELEIKVIDIRSEERRITLSLKQMQPAPERREREPRENSDVAKYQAKQAAEETKTTIGDLIGVQLSDFAPDTASADSTDEEKSE